jgi:hypothetical protein
MSKRLIVVTFVLALVVVTAGARFTASAHGGRPLATNLSGAEEVNAAAVPNQGDPDGSGSVNLTFNRGQGEICYEFKVSGIALPATAAHIHFAPAGKNGPVMVQFSAPDASGTSSGCVNADRDLVKAISKNPSDYYVNVHNGEFPSGALRGQLGD